ncbi:DUF7549 family protein [Halosimplex salinum]|uniref:DUF7549 family protein n=1 Tax=Halosimplex salinum TaxID=1710538 RepID=UPI000F46EED6|nr:hypothetical protein [Halosimplex salinum]
MWVRSEYAGELAVLATWLTALLPWSVSFLRRSPQGMDATFTVVNIRFVFFQFHYLFGISLGEQSLGQIVQIVYEIPGFVPDNQVLEGQIWLAAAAVFALLLAASFVYYARDERLEDAADEATTGLAESLPDSLADRLTLDPVRVFGAAFAVLATVFSVATAMFLQHQPTIPVGALFMWVFAAMLLTVERT